MRSLLLSLTLSFSLPAGGPGTATVNGADYDLAKGRLFLVKPTGDKLEVRQLDVDLSGIKLGTRLREKLQLPCWGE